MASQYLDYITVEHYDKIIGSWKGEFPQGDHNWWKTYSPFIRHILESVSVPKYFDSQIEEHYEEYLPILKRYFLDEEEYKTIAHNLACLKKETLDGIIDTPMFKVFTLLKAIGVLPNISELLNMDYKSFIKLYLYIMGDKLMPSNEQGVYHR